MATLTDTGPLVALIDRGEERHGECRELLPTLTAPLVTTWPCIKEAMHLLEYSGGWRHQKALWTLIETGALSIHALTGEETTRMAALMEKYHDTPMDLAMRLLWRPLKPGSFGASSLSTATSAYTARMTENRLK